MADRAEFGKRRPVRLPDAPPEPAPKRSQHVALLVMGTFVVGGFASAWIERQNCQPAQVPPGAAAPATLQASCSSRGSSYSGHSARYGFFSSGSSGGSGGSDSASGGVSRGGFGGFARAFGFGGS
jgi:hypothetical protein